MKYYTYSYGKLIPANPGDLEKYHGKSGNLTNAGDYNGHFLSLLLH